MYDLVRSSQLWKLHGMFAYLSEFETCVSLGTEGAEGEILKLSTAATVMWYVVQNDDGTLWEQQL